MAGAHGDAVAVEDLGDVVAVDPLELERDRAEAIGEGGAEDAQAGDFGDRVERVVAISRSWAVIRSIPSRSSQRSAAARPIAWVIAGVPASKRAGGSAQSLLLGHLGIIEPPPRNGGISRSRSRRPQSTPIPVGA